MKKIQYLRGLTQLIFLSLLILGLYNHVRGTLIFLVPIGLIIGNYFCGWACPFGTAQENTGKIGSAFIKKKFQLPAKYQKYAKYSRYLVLLAVLTLGASQIIDLVPLNAYRSFFALLSSRPLEWIAYSILAFFLLLSFFVERPFCNYACTEGIKFALPNLARLYTIKRNSDTCIQCHNCDRVCSMNIHISNTDEVRNPQCINCFKCISNCPVKNTLTYGKTTLTLTKIKEKITTLFQKNPTK